MNDIVTVYVAELARRIKSRPFLVGLIVGVIAIACIIKLPALFAGSSQKLLIVAAPADASRASALLGSDYDVVGTLPPTPIDAALLTGHDAGSAVVISHRNGSIAIDIYAKDPGTISSDHVRRDLYPLAVAVATGWPQSRLQQIVNTPVEVHPVSSKFASSADSEVAHGIGFVLLFLLYLLILLNSTLVMSSVTEEKTSRIAELLVASVDPAALLAGKIGAATTLAFVQMVVWIAAVAALSLGGAPAASGGGRSAAAIAALLSGEAVNGTVVLAFVVFFILGLLQLSTCYAALASLISRTEDVGSVSLPLTLPVVLAFVIAINGLDAPDTPLVVGLSFVPLLSPFVMFARVAVSDVPLWQLTLSILINAVALGAIGWAAGKVYRVGMLLYGRAPNLKQVWSVIRS
jgi:ABC-type Na+ efflux pump permease subunit